MSQVNIPDDLQLKLTIISPINLSNNVCVNIDIGFIIKKMLAENAENEFRKTNEEN